MRGAFDDEEEIRPPKPGNDTEFTLGFGTMLVLFAGLIVVCGVCFELGYMAGLRGATATAAQQAKATQVSLPAGGTQPKPSATSQAAATLPVQSAQQPDVASQSVSTNLPQSTASVAIPVAPPQDTPQVRLALPAAGSALQPVAAYPSRPAANTAQPQVRPASMPPTVPLWVQIAAISHVEDAEVLANALRKHGYTVTARREADNMIHVRIGPFSSHDEANRWRTRLLDDGYNAEIQQ